MRTAIDEAELCANRLIEFLKSYSDAGTFSRDVLNRIEGAFTVIVLEFIKEKEGK